MKQQGVQLFQRIYYQYTSIEAFLKIMTSSTIFLTYHKYLSHYVEPKAINGFLAEVMKEIEFASCSDVTTRIQEILLEPHNGAYLGCFSKAGNVLSQWLTYADDGFGVSIGFDFSEIRKQFPQNLNYSEVIYDAEY